ncbi:MiaB/RimO family radical SAM methylthiotransferase [Candidatus Dojkabacteria bacterium]|nr:MiaB/RimO family radical SAM methylthiotransferase [Candidatus Dojkabacteria bacterium]
MGKKYYIKTFGCQMNYSDSERFAHLLEKIGYKPAENIDNADLIIFNSCSIRQKAEDRISGLRPRIERLKSQKPGIKVVLSGCMARRTWDGNPKSGSPLQMKQKKRESELKKQMPWIDIVIETKELAKLPQKLGIKIKIKRVPKEYLSYTPKYSSSFQAYVPISTGCNHFCTYCIVPFARGIEINRSAREIISEIKGLVQKEYRDITLLGQTVNRWISPEITTKLKKEMIANTNIPWLNKKLLDTKKIKLKNQEKTVIDSNCPEDFLQLLQILDEIDGNWWMTFMSSHPNYMTDELITFIGRSVRENKHIRPYLHFALQSGNNNILRRMNRKYTVEEFRKKVEKMEKEIPGLSISTDIIVGFPGESDKDFMDTVKLMKDLKFDMAYINEYSPRKGTVSELLKNNIPHAEKERRKTYLNDEILAKTALKKNKLMIGTVQNSLITEIKGQTAKGQTSNMKDIRIELATGVEYSADNLKIKPGDFYKVRITGATSWALTGTFL